MMNRVVKSMALVALAATASAAPLERTSWISDPRADTFMRANAILPEGLRVSQAEADAAVAEILAARKALGYVAKRPYNTWHSFRRWTKGEVWEKHRELFGLMPNGKRGIELEGFPPWMGGLSKVCVSNGDVIDRRIAEWKAAGAPATIEGAEDDGLLGYCRCDRCRALDADRPGEPFLATKTDRYVDFWNRLAAKAREIRPDVRVVVYLYSVLRHPPRREKVAFPDNMFFIYVPTYHDADPAEEIRGWKRAGLKHFCVRPNYISWTSALPIGREKFICDVHHALEAEGSSGDYFDAVPGNPATEFEEYAAVRLCARPGTDFGTIERDWCARFGAAAETARAYYARVRERCDREWARLLARQRETGVEYLDDSHFRRDAVQLHSIPELEGDLALLEAFDARTADGDAARLFARLKANARHRILTYRALVTKSEADKRALVAFRTAHRGELGLAWAEYWKKGEQTLWSDTAATRRYEALAVVPLAEKFEDDLARPDRTHRGPLASLAPDRVETPLRVPMKRIGTLVPRSADEIADSNWTVGCETIERGYADFWQYADYLVPLGIKTIRIQSGWARCEPKPGKYDFGWLDDVIDFAIDRGLNVLLETSYGNPAYPHAGGWDLGAGFPTGEDGLAAWDRWIATLASRYRGKVRDWAMWNEPDIRNPAVPGDAGEKKPEDIAAFNVRTAKIIRSIIPDARLAGLSLARIHEPEFFERCVKAMGPDVNLFRWMIHHGYAYAPESSYGHLDRLAAILRKYNPAAKMRQGENGCPSEYASKFALSGTAWSEYSQAKWDMRRMLGDLGHGFESSVFTICDFNHRGREINRKGLLRATASRKVISVKRAYYAVQNVASLFDASVSLVATPSVTNVDNTVVLNEYRTSGGSPLYVFWACGYNTVHNEHTYRRYMTLDYRAPGDSFETRPTVLTAKGGPLADPVWVDLLTGRVYEFPADEVHTVDGETVYTNVPTYDSPCILTERKALLISTSPM